MSGGPIMAPKRSNVALIVSLCLNLILIGVIAMGLWRIGMRPPPPGGPGMLSPQLLMRLAPNEADKIGAVLEAHRDRLVGLHHDAVEARRQARRIFLAPDFSQQAFVASLDRVNQADSALEAERLKVVSESIATLTPEERRTIAQWSHERTEERRHHMESGGGF